jgi:hypothetical protein
LQGITPTHIFQIDYSNKPFSSTTIMMSTVKDGCRWYEVLPCPQPKAVAMAKSNEPKNRELEPRGKLLASDSKIHCERKSFHWQERTPGRRHAEIRRSVWRGTTVAKFVMDMLAPRQMKASGFG